MQITVTQKHINKGQPGCPGKCPITLALLDAGFDEAQTHAGVAELKGNDMGDYLVGDLSSEAQEFILRYDNHRPVKPFTFELDL